MKLRVLIALFGGIVCLMTSACDLKPDTTEDTSVKVVETLPADISTENTAYVRLRAEPDGLNPLSAVNTYSRQVNYYIFHTLLNFDPETLELVPVLAKSRPVVEEITENEKFKGMSYTFEILDEAAWDNGTPITGHDYVFTLKALFNPKVPSQRIRPFYEFISKIEVDKSNPKKFTIFTNNKYILTEDALGTMYFMPEYIYDPKGIMKNYTLEQLLDIEGAAKMADTDPKLQEFADEFSLPKYTREKDFVNASGPYYLEEWETGQHIILKKKENWWGTKLAENNPMLMAGPDVIHFKILGDQSTALTTLKSRDLDAINQMQPEDYLDLQKNEEFKEYFDLHNPVNPAYYFTFLNTRSPKLSDKRVRRALAHLTDVDEIVNTLLKGMAVRTNGPVHPDKSYYHKDLPLIKYDFEKAKTLLTEAGWTDTNNNGTIDKEIDGELVEMELEYLVSASSKNEESRALVLQNNAKKAGINITVVPKNFRVKTDDLKKHNFELSSGGWASPPTPFEPKQIWHSQSYGGDGSNYVGFGSEESDALIDEIRETMDEKEREKLYLRFQEIIYDEQPYIFSFFSTNPIAISKRFEAEAYNIRPGYFPNRFVLKDQLMGK